MVKLEITKEDRVYCDLYIKPYNSAVMKAIKFKVDTGADFTTISKEHLYELRYPLTWIDKMKQKRDGDTKTASGEEVTSYDIPIPIFNLYGMEGQNYPFGILMDRKIDPPTPVCINCKYIKSQKVSYSNLLGNDILSHFDIITDRDKGIMYLKRRINYVSNRQIRFQNQRLGSVEDYPKELEP